MTPPGVSVNGTLAVRITCDVSKHHNVKPTEIQHSSNQSGFNFKGKKNGTTEEYQINTSAHFGGYLKNNVVCGAF